jgi:tRNA (mo5U34)-methyltransferase
VASTPREILAHRVGFAGLAETTKHSTQRSPDEARDFIETSTFQWHQRFDLAPGIPTPGANQVKWLLSMARLPERLAGKSVLDIGTANGGALFELERRGAERLVGVDIYPPDFYGSVAIGEFLGSRAEFIQGNVYDLATRMAGERFDIVLGLGVIYHLRHPLLGLDNIWRLVADDGIAVIETQVADTALPSAAARPFVQFYRYELENDSSNWFVPTTTALTEWCRSSGLNPMHIETWPDGPPIRALAVLERLDKQEYLDLSYELPIRGVPAET